MYVYVWKILLTLVFISQVSLFVYDVAVQQCNQMHIRSSFIIYLKYKNHL